MEPTTTGISIAVLIAVLELIKRLGFNPKYVPLVAVVIGILANIANTLYGGGVIYDAGMTGLVIGLSAVGLYSGGKNTIEAFKGSSMTR